MPKKKGGKMPNESREQKFIRLATTKVNSIIAAHKRLGTLSRFKPTQAQRDKVFNTLKSSLESAYASWEGKGEQKEFQM